MKLPLVLFTSSFCLLTPLFATSLVDTDGDGVYDDADNCPTVWNPFQEDLDLDRAGNACQDWDADGLHDDEDNCARASNPAQADLDSDGTGDACDDGDRDGYPDGWEMQHSACFDPQVRALGDDQDNDGLPDYWEWIGGHYGPDPFFTDPCDPDSDDDGFLDAEANNEDDGCPSTPDPSGDNCPVVHNPDQTNTDCDELGDACDLDDDDDGIPDEAESSVCEDPLLADGNLDPDGDRLENLLEFEKGTNPCIADTDTDGAKDSQDNCPTRENRGQSDRDHDEIGNACDAVVSPLLRVARTNGCTLSWNPVDAATGYEVVRGDASVLKSTLGDFVAATGRFQRINSHGTTLPCKATLPANGIFFYLVRGVGAGTTYDDTFGSHQIGKRDAEIGASSAARFLKGRRR